MQSDVLQHAEAISPDSRKQRFNRGQSMHRDDCAATGGGLVRALSLSDRSRGTDEEEEEEG